MKRKLARGIVDRIGGPASFRFEAMGSIAAEKTLSVANHEQMVRLVIEWINSRADLQPITGVRHWVVHGSERFTTSVVIDDGVVSALDAFWEIAPLHNPGAVAGIRAARQILSDGSLTGLACVGSQNCEVVTMNFAYAAKAARSCTITFYLIHGMQIAPIRIRDER